MSIGIKALYAVLSGLFIGYLSDEVSDGRTETIIPNESKLTAIINCIKKKSDSEGSGLRLQD